jgi:hypothetical protein
MLKHKFLFHYVPLLITCLYLPCILFYLIFFFPCTQHFDYTKYECGIPCFVEQQPLGLLNEVIHIFLPVLLIVIFNALLIVRVIILKKRTRSSSSSSNIWKQNRHMIMQLTTICLLASLAWIPYVIVILIQILIDPALGSTVLFFYFINATYIPSFGTPLLAVLGFPQEIREKVFPCFMYLKRRREQNPSSRRT